MLHAYQVENSGGVGLVLGALGQEQKALAGLSSPGDNGLGNSRLLVLLENGQLLSLNGLVAEVEETLGETETPVWK